MQVLNNAKMAKKSSAHSESSATSRSAPELAGKPQAETANEEAADSESDSDQGLPPALPVKAPGLALGFKMPALSLGGLGLSTLKKDGESMTQEELADAKQLQE